MTILARYTVDAQRGAFAGWFVVRDPTDRVIALVRDEAVAQRMLEMLNTEPALAKEEVRTP